MSSNNEQQKKKASTTTPLGKSVGIRYYPLPPEQCRHLLQPPFRSQYGMGLHDMYIVLTHRGGVGATDGGAQDVSKGTTTSTSTSTSTVTFESASSAPRFVPIHVSLVPTSIHRSFLVSSSSSAAPNVPRSTSGLSSTKLLKSSAAEGGDSSPNPSLTSQQSAPTASSSSLRVRHHEVAYDPQLKPYIQEKLKMEKILKEKCQLHTPEEKALVQVKIRRKMVDAFCPTCGTVYLPEAAVSMGMKCRSCPRCPLCSSVMQVAFFGEQVSGSGPAVYRFQCSACHWRTPGFATILPDLSLTYLSAQRAKVKLLPYVKAISIMLQKYSQYSTSKLLRNMKALSSSSMKSGMRVFDEMEKNFKELYKARYHREKKERFDQQQQLLEQRHVDPEVSTKTTSSSIRPKISTHSNVIKAITLLEQKLALATDIMLFPNDHFAVTGGTTSLLDEDLDTSSSAPSPLREERSVSIMHGGATITPSASLLPAASPDFIKTFPLESVEALRQRFVFESAPPTAATLTTLEGEGTQHALPAIETAKSQLHLGSFQQVLSQRGINLSAVHPQQSDNRSSSPDNLPSLSFTSPTKEVPAGSPAGSPSSKEAPGSPSNPSSAKKMWNSLKTKFSKSNASPSSPSSSPVAANEGAVEKTPPNSAAAVFSKIDPEEEEYVIDGTQLCQRYTVLCSALDSASSGTSTSSSLSSSSKLSVENRILFQPSPSISTAEASSSGQMELPFRRHKSHVRIGLPQQQAPDLSQQPLSPHGGQAPTWGEASSFNARHILPHVTPLHNMCSFQGDELNKKLLPQEAYFPKVLIGLPPPSSSSLPEENFSPAPSLQFRYFSLFNMTQQNVEVVDMKIAEWENLRLAPYLIGSGSKPSSLPSAINEGDEEKRKLEEREQKQNTEVEAEKHFPASATESGNGAGSSSSVMLTAWDVMQSPKQFFVTDAIVEQFFKKMEETSKLTIEESIREGEGGKSEKESSIQNNNATTTTTTDCCRGFVQDHPTRAIFGLAFAPKYTADEIQQVLEPGVLQPRVVMEIDVKIVLPIPQITMNESSSGSTGLKRVASTRGSGMKKETVTGASSSSSSSAILPPTVQKTVRLKYYSELRFSE